jgi:Lipoprotein LpqB beta-propeller domain/Sporulation and spore germination
MRMTERSRRVRAAFVAIFVAVALVGCVAIPSSGGVNPGPLVQSGGGAAPADLPLGPPRNASKTEMVNDFLQAATSAEGNYAIAKSFLTASAAQKWDPTKSVLVREKPATPQDIGDNTVDYAVSTKASVNALGVYVEQSTDSTQTFSYNFVKVGGQWRISDLPDGIVLSRTSFENFFQPYPIYFFDPDYRYLVPDVRWFPTGLTVQDRIVSALIAGPTEWLQGGVVASAFPAGVGRGSPVVIRNSTATVDFSANAASTKEPALARMQRQLEESLLSTNITSVAMTARGAPMPVPDSQRSKAVPANAINSSPLLQRGKQFGFWPGLSSLGAISTQIAALGGSAATLDRSQSTAAVLARGDVYLVTGAGAKVVDSRQQLIAPSIDPFGYVWSVPATDASAIRAVASDGVVHSITSTVPAGATVVSLDVSHDGTRVLLYLATSAGPRLIVAGIVRRAGVPTSLGELLDLPVSSAQPIDAAWVDQMTVAALGSDSGEDSVVSYLIGGSPSEASTTEGGVRLVGGQDSESLRLLTQSGEVEQLRASGWQNIGVVASMLATQQ